LVAVAARELSSAVSGIAAYVYAVHEAGILVGGGCNVYVFGLDATFGDNGKERIGEFERLSNSESFCDRTVGPRSMWGITCLMLILARWNVVPLRVMGIPHLISQLVLCDTSSLLLQKKFVGFWLLGNIVEYLSDLLRRGISPT
jgi:hypothetical protein